MKTGNITVKSICELAVGDRVDILFPLRADAERSAATRRSTGVRPAVLEMWPLVTAVKSLEFCALVTVNDAATLTFDPGVFAVVLEGGAS